MSAFSGKTVLGTLPSPLVIDFPFIEHKLPYLVTRHDCLYFQLFLTRRSADGNNRGTGDTASNLQARPKDDIFKQFTGGVNEQPLVVHKLLFEKTLTECGNVLKVLSLSFCYSVDEEVIQLIAKNCKLLEYLDLSFSSPVKCHNETKDYKTDPEGSSLSPISVDAWKSLTDSIGEKLKHLNLTCFTAVDDEGLSELLRHCPNIEELHVSIAPFHLLKGHSLINAPKSLRKITIFVDEKEGTANVGVSALTALSNSEAKQTLELLRIRRCLTNEMLTYIAANFAHLKSFDIVESCSESFDYTKMSEPISVMTDLESLSVHIPEDHEFDDDLALITKCCSKLKALAVFGGEINDETLKLLSTHVPNLEYLALSHLMFPCSLAFDHSFTDSGLKSLAKLKQLKYLKINQARITDRGVNDFLLAFRGDINKLEYLDFRECPKVTTKTMKLCVDKSTSRSNYLPPLRILMNGTQFKMDPRIRFEPTAIVPTTWWVNYPGFWNEYFTPYLNASQVTENCQRFVENALQYLAGHYVHTTFTKLRTFVLKVPKRE